MDAVLVATDDERIADAVDRLRRHRRHDARDDHETGTDRLAEVAAALDGDLIVNVQGDEPLISPDAIDAAVGAAARSARRSDRHAAAPHRRPGRPRRTPAS